MATTIRSAVIEMGIRQLQAKLVPPDIAAIVEANKSLDAMGVSAQRAAELATKEWGSFALTVRELQEELIRTGDTFEKVLADGVAWEETLPRISSGTDDAARAGHAHAGALGKQLKGFSELGHGSLLAARGVLFLVGADKEHERAMIEKLFLLQGAIDLTKGLSLAYRGLAHAIRDVTIAELAMKAANPEFAAIAIALAALAATGYTVYHAFTATSTAVSNLTDDYKHNAEQASSMAQLFALQAEYTNDLKERLFLLRAAYADLTTEQAKSQSLSQTAASLGYYDKAAESAKTVVEKGKELLGIEEKKAQARVHDIELQDKLIDRKLEELRLAKELDDRNRKQGSSLFEMGPEGRAKLGVIAGQSGGFKDLSKLSEQMLTFLAHSPDANLATRAEREESRRFTNSPLAGIIATAPVDPATLRDREIAGGASQKRDNSKAIEQIGKDFDKLAATMVEGIRRAQQRLDEIENAARAKSTGRGGYGWVK